MPDADRNIRMWGIIPAAGLSRRMGRPKQSLPFQGSTITATVARTLLDADLTGVIAVTRTDLIGELKLPDDPRLQLAVNDDPNSEMIDSIRIGLATLDRLQPGGNDGILVVPGDMPTLSPQSCRECIAAYIADPGRMVIAAHAGKRGHPIVFPFAMRATVDQLEGGLNMLPRACPGQVLLVDVDDPGVALDVDTTEDLAHL